jgi:hypothetical protein
LGGCAAAAEEKEEEEGRGAGGRLRLDRGGSEDGAAVGRKGEERGRERAVRWPAGLGVAWICRGATSRERRIRARPRLSQAREEEGEDEHRDEATHWRRARDYIAARLRLRCCSEEKEIDAGRERSQAGQRASAASLCLSSHRRSEGAVEGRSRVVRRRERSGWWWWREAEDERKRRVAQN